VPLDCENQIVSKTFLLPLFIFFLGFCQEKNFFQPFFSKEILSSWIADPFEERFLVLLVMLFLRNDSFWLRQFFNLSHFLQKLSDMVKNTFFSMILLFRKCLKKEIPKKFGWKITINLSWQKYSHRFTINKKYLQMPSN